MSIAQSELVEKVATHIAIAISVIFGITAKVIEIDPDRRLGKALVGEDVRELGFDMNITSSGFFCFDLTLSPDLRRKWYKVHFENPGEAIVGELFVARPLSWTGTSATDRREEQLEHPIFYRTD